MTNNDSGHQYTVELRVYGPNLQPSQITREAGLEPCQTRAAGSPKGDRVYTQNLWAFDGGFGGAKEWTSLEEGLAFVLDQVADLRELFARYREQHQVVWWCGHFQSRFDGGPQFSAKLLERLGSFGVDLFIDNYYSAQS